MKFLPVIIISILAFAACKNDDKKTNGADSAEIAKSNDSLLPQPIDPAKLTTVQWIDSLKNFGEVKEGEKVNIKFRFKNTGERPLIIESVVPGCGCTAPDYSKEPVMPGKEGFITAEFNSANQHESVHKNVNVAMNTNPKNHALIFEGKVIKKQ